MTDGDDQVLVVPPEIPAERLIAALRRAVGALDDEAIVLRHLARNRPPAYQEAAEQDAQRVEEHAAVVNTLLEALVRQARDGVSSSGDDSSLLARAEGALRQLDDELRDARDRARRSGAPVDERRVGELSRRVDEQRQRVDSIRTWWDETVNRGRRRRGPSGPER